MVTRDDLLAAREAAYWLADCVHLLCKMAAQRNIHEFKKCITRAEPQSDDSEATIDFGELFRNYEAAIGPALPYIPSISEAPPSFGRTSPCNSLHAAILAYGKELSWHIQCCHHTVVAIGESTDENCSGQEALAPGEYLSENAALVDDRVMSLMDQLCEDKIPPAGSLEYQLNREYEAAELRFAVCSAPAHIENSASSIDESEYADGPVEPDGFRWKGEVAIGLKPTAFRLLKFHWDNGKWVTRYFDKDDFAGKVFLDHGESINRSRVDAHQTVINRAFVESEMLLYMKVEQKRTFVVEISQERFAELTKKRMRRKKP